MRRGRELGNDSRIPYYMNSRCVVPQSLRGAVSKADGEKSRTGRIEFGQWLRYLFRTYPNRTDFRQ